AEAVEVPPLSPRFDSRQRLRAAIDERGLARPALEGPVESRGVREPEEEGDLSEGNALIRDVAEREPPAQIFEKIAERGACPLQPSLEGAGAHAQPRRDAIHAGRPLRQLGRDGALDPSRERPSLRQLLQPLLEMDPDDVVQAEVRAR